MKIESIITCAVVCPEDREFVARSFMDIVTKRFDSLKTESRRGSLSEIRSDIVVPIVNSGDCSAIDHQMVCLIEVCPEVLIVPLTIRLSYENIAGLVRAGARDFISVPFEFDE